MTTKIQKTKNVGTFSRILIHIVFAVRGRQSLIDPNWEEQLYKYISWSIEQKDQKLLAINGIGNHIHILLSVKPSCCISDFVRELKKSTNSFVNEKKFTEKPFTWQNGFGVFSCGYSQLDLVMNYIQNQKEYHQKHGFKEEYLGLLTKAAIDYDDRFLFQWVEE